MPHPKILLSSAHFANDINTAAIPALLPFLAAIHGFSYTGLAVILFS